MSIQTAEVECSCHQNKMANQSPAEELFSQAGIFVSLHPTEAQVINDELVSVVSREISQRSGYDFDIPLERQHFRNGVLDKEGLKNEVKTFIWEYLTDLKISEFFYTVREGEGTFGNGWDRSMEEMLSSSLNVALNPNERALRQAELDGFLEIKEGLVRSPSKSALYISPSEAYNSNFALAYIFTRAGTETGEFILEAKLYRIYGANIDKHYAVLEALGRKFTGDVPSGIDVNSPASFIANPLFVEADEDILDFLIEEYDGAIDQDGKQQGLFDDFLEFVDQFVELFSNFEYPDEVVEMFFKMLLAKAMVHFNEVEAGNIFDQDVIEQIKQSDLNAMLSNRKLFSEIPNTRLLLSNGTCGTIGELSISGVVKALYRLSHPGIDMESEVFVCPRCGEIHDISDGYVQSCRRCGYNAVCK